MNSLFDGPSEHNKENASSSYHTKNPVINFVGNFSVDNAHQFMRSDAVHGTGLAARATSIPVTANLKVHEDDENADDDSGIKEQPLLELFLAHALLSAYNPRITIDSKIRTLIPSTESAHEEARARGCCCEFHVCMTYCVYTIRRPRISGKISANLKYFRTCIGIPWHKLWMKCAKKGTLTENSLNSGIGRDRLTWTRYKSDLLQCLCRY